MGTKVVRLVALFAIISVAGIVFVGFRYVGAGALVGLGPYTVAAQFREPGGIFPKASVSYRGVEIGKVGDMRITPQGVEVDLEIENGSPPVPANAMAAVMNRSAVGEQYVDLQPTSDGAPYLEDGSEIPIDRTRTPVEVDQLLASLNALVNSVPKPELRTTVDELYNAFDRAGPDLQRLIDSSNPLVRDAIANLPPTVQLLRDGKIVLGTQADLGPEILSLSRDLNVFTAQLKRDDPNLRRLLNAAPPAATQLEGLIRETGPDLGRVIANLLTVSGVLQPRLAGVEQALVVYPILSAAAPTVVPGDGYAHFGLVLNINDPPPCRAGYMPVGEWRTADQLDYATFDTNIRCREGPPVNVRGAQNAPLNSGTVRGNAPQAQDGAGADGSGTDGTPGDAASPAAAQNPGATSVDPVPTDGRVATDSGYPIVIPGLG